MARHLVILLLAIASTLAPVLASPQNLADAIEEHRRLVAETPTPGVLNDLANLLVLAGNVAEAESTYRHVLSIDAANIEAQFNPIMRSAVKDNSLRYVQVIFMASLNASESRVYTLKDNGGQAVSNPIQVNETASAVTVNTGEIEFRVTKRALTSSMR